MRILCLLVLAFGLASSASALEATAAGASVDAGQAGLNAKIDTDNVSITSVMNQMFACNHANALFDAATNTCKQPVDPSVVQKMADCNTAQQFYDQTTDSCQSLGLPPDMTSQTTTNTTRLNAVLNCNKSGQFYNSTTNTCVVAAGGTVKFGGASANQGGYGVNVPCPSGDAVTSLCTSGQNADCHQAGSAFTYLQCKKLSIQ